VRAAWFGQNEPLRFSLAIQASQPRPDALCALPNISADYCDARGHRRLLRFGCEKKG